MAFRTRPTTRSFCSSRGRPVIWCRQMWIRTRCRWAISRAVFPAISALWEILINPRLTERLVAQLEKAAKIDGSLAVDGDGEPPTPAIRAHPFDAIGAFRLAIGGIDQRRDVIALLQLIERAALP